jgi:nucleoside-diphosphate-sugar epimerase
MRTPRFPLRRGAENPLLSAPIMPPDPTPALPAPLRTEAVEPVHVVGAAGRSGAALCRLLADQGIAYVPVVRSKARWRALGLPGERRVADLADPPALAQALGDAALVISCAHARHTPAILAATRAECRYVLLGSTRRFTRWPDNHGLGVQAGEAAFMASSRRGVMLHPTMIYGAQGEDNVQRLAALLRRLPVVPLPGGGRALVQPIYQDDVTRCVLAAMKLDWPGPRSMVIAGPTPLPYADFVRAVAHAAGLPRPRIVNMPARLLIAAAPLTRRLRFLPRIDPAEIRRLQEDKAFPIDAMLATLDVHPVSLEEGLARTFAAPSKAA